MRKKAVITALILILSALFTGCSLGLGDASLLHPPKTTGKEARLESLIDDSTGGSYKLKYPQSGLYRSAIITEDLNGDKKDEAIAFYKTDNDNSTTYMLLMYDTGKEWRLSKSFKLNFSDIDCVQFADYDFDGVEEIFIGFVNLGKSSKTLNIFNYNPNNKTSERVNFSHAYSGFTTGDYDQDGGSELLTFTLNSAETDAEAVLTDYDKNELYTLAKCDMDPNVTKLENITTGLINKDTTGVAVDGLMETSYNSQVIYYNIEKEQLFNFPITVGKKNISTVRTDKINSTDIDDDGFIEIPIIKNTAYKSVPKEETVAPIISWSNINTKNNKLDTKVKCVSDFAFGYYFKLPDKLSSSTVATLSEDKRTMKIYSKESDSAGSLIVTFKVFDVGTSTDKMNGYSTLESYNQYIYTYKIEENSPIYISGSTLKENFSLSDNSD